MSTKDNTVGSDRQRIRERFQLSIIMLLIGLVIATSSWLINDSPELKLLVGDIGYAFIVAGAVSFFLEYMNLRVGSVDQDKFDKLFQILSGPVMRKIIDERKDYDKYHEWAIEKGSHEIFFAGHSVLHRIDADFKTLPLKSAVNAVLNKIEDGSNIQIMFLDPRWEFLATIAKSQNQEINDLNRDLLRTLEICKELSDKLAQSRRAGRLEIAMCTEINQYSYHYVKNLKTNKVEMLVGLYFAGRLGINCPLFRTENVEIQGCFKNHFDEIFRRSDKLLIYSRGFKDFDNTIYDACISKLQGEEE